MPETGSIEFRRRIPVRCEVDVFVAGAGPAGVAAALAAAREGSRVYLAEGHTCFGGAGTAGLVPCFMQFSDGENFLAGGIGEEIYERLWRAGGTGPDDDPQNPYLVACIRSEVLKRLYDEMVSESGVDFTFQTQVIGVKRQAGPRVTHAVCAARSGLFSVAAKCFIDCTGDGDLAAWAGAAFEKGDDAGMMMAGTLCSLWSGIDWDAVHSEGRDQQDALQVAIEQGDFPVNDPHLPGMFRVGASLGIGNLGHTYGVDGTCERSLTEAFVYGRKLLLEYERFYKCHLKGFENMELAATASLLGVRESRRILGDHLLCLDDFRMRAVFPDEIGRYAYPVDIHASRPGEEAFARMWQDYLDLRYKKGESYGIPYRALTPRGLDNVLVAGRCISSDRYLQGSTRVMPGCYITGQAAGVAAALAAELDRGTREIPVSELQRRLKAMGAYLPNLRADS